MYLLDTNVISELRRNKPNPNVLKFFEQVKEQQIDCYVSVITLGEIQSGVVNLENKNDFQQAKLYQKWFDEINQEFAEYKLDFDEKSALNWSQLIGKNPHNAIDKQIAATALVYDLTLVSRNAKHFVDTPVKLLNPFNEE